MSLNTDYAQLQQYGQITPKIEQKSANCEQKSPKQGEKELKVVINEVFRPIIVEKKEDK